MGGGHFTMVCDGLWPSGQGGGRPPIHTPQPPHPTYPPSRVTTEPQPGGHRPCLRFVFTPGPCDVSALLFTAPVCVLIQ